jgi:alpha-L-arabinofuranosidase
MLLFTMEWKQSHLALGISLIGDWRNWYHNRKADSSFLIYIPLPHRKVNERRKIVQLLLLKRKSLLSYYDTKFKSLWEMEWKQSHLALGISLIGDWRNWYHNRKADAK